MCFVHLAITCSRWKGPLRFAPQRRMNQPKLNHLWVDRWSVNETNRSSLCHSHYPVQSKWTETISRSWKLNFIYSIVGAQSRDSLISERFILFFLSKIDKVKRKATSQKINVTGCRNLCFSLKRENMTEYESVRLENSTLSPIIKKLSKWDKIGWRHTDLARTHRLVDVRGNWLRLVRLSDESLANDLSSSSLSTSWAWLSWSSQSSSSAL